MILEVRNSAIVLLVCAVMFGSGWAHAQARGPEVPGVKQPVQAETEDEIAAARAAKLAELETWLKRLVGRFQYEGSMIMSTWDGCLGCGERAGYIRIGEVYYVQRELIGTGDCRGFGTGSGVHCVVKVPWPSPAVVSPMGRTKIFPWPGPALDPAMFLYGIDPDNVGIRLLLVDGQSIATTMLGFLQDDTVTFKACPGVPQDACKRIFRVRAKSEGNIEFSQQLRERNERYSFFLLRLPDSDDPENKRR